MSKIRIKNFGPINEGYQENDGWLDVKKVTVFIGNQGSGKSTIAKLITTFMWIEKALTRGDYDESHFTKKNKLKNNFLAYFRLENYFPSYDGLFDNTVIEYQGESYYLEYKMGEFSIRANNNTDYELPQIMYVPSERNFISNVKTPKALKLTSDSLIEFVTEYDNSKNEIKENLALPINNVEVEYNSQYDVINIKGKVKNEPYKIKLTEASSGFQSIVPLFLVSWYLANSVKKQSENGKELMTSELRERFRKEIQLIDNIENLSNEQRRILISESAKKYNKTAFINIVEEPEQNLFPSSQRAILNSLLEFNNMNEGNKLIMTTHSPYLINYLTLAVKAEMVKSVLNSDDLKKKLAQIVPLESTINSSDLIIYELNELDGSIKILPDYKGLPSDENYLNCSLEDSNELFAQLQELEKGW